MELLKGRVTNVRRVLGTEEQTVVDHQSSRIQRQRGHMCHFQTAGSAKQTQCIHHVPELMHAVVIVACVFTHILQKKMLCPEIRLLSV